MRKLILIIFLSVFSPNLATRHKIMMSWREKRDFLLEGSMLGVQEMRVTEKPKDEKLTMELELRNTSMAELGHYPFYALLMMKKPGSEW